jgi:hypothetical protein
MTSTIDTIRLQPRTITITAPRGIRGQTARELRRIGARGSKDLPRSAMVLPALSGSVAQDVVMAARAGLVRLARPETTTAPITRVPASAYPIGILKRACRRGRGFRSTSRRPYAARATMTADEAVQAILDRVGHAGEQARADEERYFVSHSSEWETKRGTIGRDARAVSRAWTRPDGSAAIISYVEWGAWGQTSDRSPTGKPRGGIHHIRVRAYLIVRDSTTGERHTIRVPPRFGRTSATLRGMGWRDDDILGSPREGEALHSIQDYRGGVPEDVATHARIHAAVAWTFGKRPAEYRPDVEA